MIRHRGGGALQKLPRRTTANPTHKKAAPCRAAASREPHGVKSRFTTQHYVGV